MCFSERGIKMDQNFSLRRVLEKCCELSVDLHILFFDFKQLCDGIYRDKIYRTFMYSGYLEN
jgi:hypothetical protein